MPQGIEYSFQWLAGRGCQQRLARLRAARNPCARSMMRVDKRALLGRDCCLAMVFRRGEVELSFEFTIAATLAPIGSRIGRFGVEQGNVGIWLLLG